MPIYRVPVNVSWTTWLDVEANSVGAAMDEAKRMARDIAPEIHGVEPDEPRPTSTAR